ncbi:MAG: LytR/AlgR family response regulator transcription factor [Bryobacteraceae bacterium]
MIRVLIVDDEQPARDRLRRLLTAFPPIQVIGEAGDGPAALEHIAELRPDAVFLDIQMPGCTGLEVAASLGSPAPRVIFCTAFDQYAVEAFELQALDYLLKPVTSARLSAAVERLFVPQPAAVRLPFPSRFLARLGGKYRVVPLRDVICLVSEEGLTRLCTRDQRYSMDPTLNDLEERLDAAVFFRVSRSAIVKLDAISEIAPLTGGYGEVLLKNGMRLEVSRRRYQQLLRRLAA